MITAFILLGLGLLAILIEFFLPGGIFGTIGVLFVVGSVVIFGLHSGSLLWTLAYIAATCVILYFMIKLTLWRIQHAKSGFSIYSGKDQEGYTASTWDKGLVGKGGIVSSDLKPGGHVVIEGKSYSAISQSGYIERGDRVNVVGGEGETLVVKKNVQGE